MIVGGIAGNFLPVTVSKSSATQIRRQPNPSIAAECRAQDHFGEKILDASSNIRQCQVLNRR
jgi:hypothetical protein